MTLKSVKPAEDDRSPFDRLTLRQAQGPPGMTLKSVKPAKGKK